MASEASPTRRQDIKALTGLRGIAAFWVVTYHYVRPEREGPPGLMALFHHGYTAVDIFFVLSGFVMSISYARFFADGFRLKNYGVFMVRRIARVYPLYLLVIVAMVGLAFLGYGDHSLRGHPLSDYIANLFMVQSWGLAKNMNPPAWSVSVELVAYLLFPLLAFVTLFRSRLLAGISVVGSLAALMAIQFFLATGQDTPEGPLDINGHASILPIIRCVAGFTLGMVSFRAANSTAVKRLRDSSILYGGLLAFVLIAMMFRNMDYEVVVWAPLLLIGLTGNNLFARAAGSRLAVFLGEISYALYLIHWPFIELRFFGHVKLEAHLGEVLAHLVAAGFFYTVVISVSFALYRLVERPARNWVRKAELIFDRGAEKNVSDSEQAGQAAIVKVVAGQP